MKYKIYSILYLYLVIMTIGWIANCMIGFFINGFDLKSSLSNPFFFILQIPTILLFPIPYFFFVSKNFKKYGHLPDLEFTGIGALIGLLGVMFNPLTIIIFPLAILFSPIGLIAGMFVGILAHYLGIPKLYLKSKFSAQQLDTSETMT